MTTRKRTNLTNPKLETANYFDQLEEQIVQKLHEESVTEEGRQQLIHSTGVVDLELTDELVKLGIPADGVVALRLFPLVLVAWADDHADASEQTTVMAEASRLGIRDDSTAGVLLKSWMKKRPPGLCVDAWRRYTHDVYSQMTAASAKRLNALTHEQMTAVAKASGGHLGFGKISAKERAVIEQISRLMKQSIPCIKTKQDATAR